MKILVTGGHGFVGSALTRALRGRYPNAQVIAPTSKEMDLLDARATDEYMKNAMPDVIYHLAARLGGVGLVSGQPLAFLENNLRINLNLMQAVEKLGGYLSSSPSAPVVVMRRMRRCLTGSLICGMDTRRIPTGSASLCF